MVRHQPQKGRNDVSLDVPAVPVEPNNFSSLFPICPVRTLAKTQLGRVHDLFRKPALAKSVVVHRGCLFECFCVCGDAGDAH